MAERPFVNARYSWKFGDEGSMHDRLARDYPFARSANVAKGPIAAHVFEEPGTYKISVEVQSERGASRTAVRTISVKSGDERYAGDSTVCYSARSNFTDCPAGAARTNRLKDAIGMLRRARTGRLLMRAGEVSSSSDTFSFRGGSGYLIGRYGEGDDPVIKVTGRQSRLFNLTAVDDFTLTNIQLRGDYDPVEGYGESRRTAGLFSYSGFDYDDRVETRNVTLHEVSASGLGINVYPAGEAESWVISDSSITDWCNFGILSGPKARRMAFIGNTIKQNRDAVQARGKDGCRSLPAYADHGPLRIEWGNEVVVSRNDFFSNTGWSSDVDHQPTIRYNTDGFVHSGNISENRLEGGYIVAALQSRNSNRMSHQGDVILADNFLIGTEMTSTFVQTSYGGAMIRDNVAIQRDESVSANQLHAFVTIRDSATSAENTTHPVDVFGNTFIANNTGRSRSIKVVNNLGGYLKVSPKVRESNRFGTPYTSID